jgi:AmpD protein
VTLVDSVRAITLTLSMDRNEYVKTRLTRAVTARLQRSTGLNDVSKASYAIDGDSGLLSEARQSPSPNQDERPDRLDPRLLVLHSISLPPGEFGGAQIEQLFLNKLDWDEHPYFAGIRDLKVSAHLLIRRDGEVLQFVPFNRRAWHAGQSAFRGTRCCNDYSIGIELEGEDHIAYTDQQYAVLTGVTSALFEAFPGLDARNIAGHCDIAPGRKVDPGPAFDWLRLYDGIASQLSGTA